jgi:Flp pilus assembly protein TadD
MLEQTLRSIASTAQRMISYDPHNLQAVIVLILIMAETGRLKESLSLLEELQDHVQINPRILSNLAIIEMALGADENYQASKLYFKKYFEKTAFHPDEHTEISLALLHIQFKNMREASNVIKK